ncbi:Dna damage-binding protein cmr1 [Thalictrum thalictroides]|uniref:WD repeat-containing protein 76 n=1 Tax=Thalictrum thalictroides TaxID=46969 RepID=A0A7J6VBS1_THATH|nr:Dna damage-binding protein cmr1 [Thalictrum thalictroides]
MASQPLTEYERKRLENIKRNAEMMASLKLQSKALELSSATKRDRIEKKGYKITPDKKPKSETPVIMRRSLRTRGLPPDPSTAKGLVDNILPPPLKTLSTLPPKSPTAAKLGPLSFQEANMGDSSNRIFIDSIMDMLDNTSFGKRHLVGSGGSLDLDSMVLKQENVVSVMPGKISNLRFFPSDYRSMIVAGDKFGNIAFWDVDSKGSDGIYLYQLHTTSISGISIHPFNLSKVFSCCYDGLVRLLDVEKESFDLVHSSDNTIVSLSQWPQDANSICFSEGRGVLNVWDMRAGKSSSSWVLHDDRINTIDINPENTNLMVTSSTDASACIWDLRQIDAGRPKNLMVVNHKKSVHSAYFSPTGSCLATTSTDNNVGIFSGADFMDKSMVYHNNHTGWLISSLRAIWGWDDSSLFIGSMKREVDVISIEGNTRSLQSSDMSAIPCRLAVHPQKVGTLAASTSGGQIYLWTQS